jgi:hypothetical protein
MLDGLSLGRIDYAGMKIRMPTGAPVSVGDFFLNNVVFARGAPVSGEFGLGGFRVTKDMTPDRRAAEGFDKLGLDALTLGMDAAFSWDIDAKQIRIPNISLKIDELGALKLSAELSNATPGDAAAMNDIRLDHAVLRYDDNSLTDRILKIAADENQSDPAALRATLSEQIAAASPMFGDSADVASSAKAISDFVAAPHALTITLNPAKPVPLARLRALRGGALAPAQIVQLLGLSVAAGP